MREAIAEARKAEAIGEVPVGAVIVHQERIIARAHNLRESTQDPLAHAEALALREAARQRSGWRLDGCTIFVTLEPCPMCAGALVNSRIDRLVFGAWDPKAGYCGSLENLLADSRLNHRVEIREGVLERECAEILKAFFSRLREARDGGTAL